MQSIKKILLQLFIISVFFFYYEFRYLSGSIHSFFLILGSLIMVFINSGKISNSFKIKYDYLIIYVLGLIIVIGFFLNIKYATFSNLQAYLLGLLSYVFVKDNMKFVKFKWVIKLVRFFLFVNSVLIIIQFITGGYFPARYFAVGDPPFLIASGVSDGPTKNGVLHAFALSVVMTCLIFRKSNFIFGDFLLLVTGLPALIFSASRAGLASFGVSVVVIISFLVFAGRKFPYNSKGLLLSCSSFLILFLITAQVGLFDLIEQLTSNPEKYSTSVVLYKLTEWEDDSLDERVKNVDGVRSAAYDSPLSFLTFGTGVGSFEVRNQGMNIHNSYLEIILQNGLFGFIAFTMIILVVFNKILTSTHKNELLPFFIGLIAIMVFMGFHDILRGRIFWMPLGILAAYSSEKSKHLFE